MDTLRKPVVYIGLAVIITAAIVSYFFITQQKQLTFETQSFIQSGKTCEKGPTCTASEVCTAPCKGTCCVIGNSSAPGSVGGSE